ncbi:MAG TPA: 2-C-methyl-D-erythritol 4-phosphate cytidylyltransferase, partial [Nocardioides sp.]
THGGGVPAAPVPPLVRRAGGPVPGLGREVHAVGVQTPQAFRAPDLLAAYRWAADERFDGTDTAACVDAWAAATGTTVRIVPVASTAPNLKVTYAEDLRVAAALSGP